MKFFLFGLIALAILTALYFYGGRRLTGSAHHSIGARKVADVHGMLVSLKINENTTLLFIVLGADGSINRVGNGTFGNKNFDMFIGKTNPAIFGRVRSHLTEEMLQGLGHTFQRQKVRGAPCKLKLIFEFNDGTSGTSEYLYGSESEGPPRDVVDFVRAAVGDTEGWYQQQLQSDSNEQVKVDSLKTQITADSFNNGTNFSIQKSILQAWFSEQCVQLLASMAKSKGASVRSSGDRLWIGGEEISVRAQIEQLEADPEKAFVGVGLKVDISVGGLPQPTLTSGVVGAAENRNDAYKQAVESWAYLVGEGLLGALGLKSETVSVRDYTVHAGMTMVRGSRSHDPKPPFSSDQDLINRLGSVIESLRSSPSKFHLISISLGVNADPHVSVSVQGECWVDGVLSPKAFKAVQSFAWPDGHYMLKQYYVLRRR